MGATVSFFGATIRCVMALLCGGGGGGWMDCREKEVCNDLMKDDLQKCECSSDLRLCYLFP